MLWINIGGKILQPHGSVELILVGDFYSRDVSVQLILVGDFYSRDVSVELILVGVLPFWSNPVKIYRAY